MQGRKATLDILEAGLEASDPYQNARELIHRERNTLIIGKKEYEPIGAPVTGDTVIDLDGIDNIYVFGGNCQWMVSPIDIIGIGQSMT